jgi:hypothetical protein
MRSAHLAALALALADDVDVDIAERITKRYANRVVNDVAKRGARRGKKRTVSRINRERSTIVTARGTMTTLLTDWFAGAARDIAEQVIAARKDVLGKADDGLDRADVDAILDAIDFSGWDDLRDQLEALLIGVTQDGIGVAFQQIGFDAPQDIVDQVNESAADWARARAADMVGMTYDADGNLVPNPNPGMAITEGTRTLLRGDVERSIEEGWSVDEFADVLSENYAFSDTRAETIAHFEIAQADVEGNLVAYRDSGEVSGKEWVLGSEHDDDDECDDAAAMGVVPLDDDFGGIGDPPAHPRCVCDILPVLADDTA